MNLPTIFWPTEVAMTHAAKFVADGDGRVFNCRLSFGHCPPVAWSSFSGWDLRSPGFDLSFEGYDVLGYFRDSTAFCLRCEEQATLMSSMNRTDNFIFILLNPSSYGLNKITSGYNGDRLATHPFAFSRAALFHCHVFVSLNVLYSCVDLKWVIWLFSAIPSKWNVLYSNPMSLRDLETCAPVCTKNLKVRQ